jgi:hypothetical protein
MATLRRVLTAFRDGDETGGSWVVVVVIEKSSVLRRRAQAASFRAGRVL